MALEDVVRESIIAHELPDVLAGGSIPEGQGAGTSRCAFVGRLADLGAVLTRGLRCRTRQHKAAPLPSLGQMPPKMLVRLAWFMTRPPVHMDSGAPLSDSRFDKKQEPTLIYRKN